MHNYEVGDVITLVVMNDDPDPIPPGTKGVVTNVHTVRENKGVISILTVDWEINRNLNVIIPTDVIKKNP